MHSILELGANVPAFLAKLWRLVDDPDTNDLISWSEDGTSFYIRDQAQFSRKLLPMYYKHNNMASFIRQLNMYGFHKIVAADAGSLRLDRDEMEFAHQCFLRGHPYLLEHIKRKNQLLSNKQLDESRVTSSGGTVVRADIMNKLLNEVKHMRGRQDTVENRLSNMKQENEALWRELSLLRQKHMKQQTIVNKLIQFLVTLVQPSQRLGKRRYPLMINNIAHPTTESKDNARPSSHQGNRNGAQSKGRRLYTLVVPSSDNETMSGTTIREVDSDMLIGEADGELLDPSITLADPDDDLAELDPNLPESDDLSSSGILGELTDELASGTPMTLLPAAELRSRNGSTASAAALAAAAAAQVIGSAADAAELNADEAIPVDILPADILLVDPLEVNPSIAVPRLSKGKMPQRRQVPTVASTVPASHTATPPTQTTATRKAATESKLLAAKTAPMGSRASLITNLVQVPAAPVTSAAPPTPTAAAAAAAIEKAVAAIKKEPRITSNRSRKRKTAPAKSMAQNNVDQMQTERVGPVDLLAEVGILSPAPTPAGTEPTNQLGVPVMSPNVCSPLSPVVVFPMSEPSDCGSPSGAPASPYMAELSRNGQVQVVEASPMTAGAPSPLVVFPGSSPAPSPASSTDQTYSTDMTLACTSQGNKSLAGGNVQPLSPESLNRCAADKEELDMHVDTLDSELGQLKDLLHNSGFSLDASTLLGLFNPDDTLPLYNQQDENEKNEGVLGNELAMYGQPDLRDVLDDYSFLERRPESCSPPPLGDGRDINTPVLTPASPGFSTIMADPKRRKVGTVNTNKMTSDLKSTGRPTATSRDALCKEFQSYLYELRRTQNEK